MSDNEIFDYIVVGAGPAGAAVARRLADAPDAPQVALVETGPAKAGLFSDMPMGLAALVAIKGRSNYAYETVPQPGLGGRRGYQPRGRGLGGSSLINAMIAIRGQPQDYDGWAAAGCSNWSWNDVLPLFKRIEDHDRGATAWHGAGGPLPISDLRHPSRASQAFVDAAVECQFRRNADFNGADQEGFGLYQVFQRDGRRVNAGRAYLDGAPANLTVLADTLARRIVVRDRRACGLVVGSARHPRELTARREIIVSAGAFGSPQLLMLSGIGPGADLRRLGIDVVHDLGGVGQNLQDHLDYTANSFSAGPGLLGMGLPTAWRALRSLGTWRKAGLGMLTSNVAEAGGFVRSSPDVDRPDLQFHFCIGLVDDHARKRHIKPGFALHVCVLRPKSRGTVSLAGTDPAAAPLIDPRYLFDPEDLDLLVKGARLSHRILQAPALRPYEGKLLYGTGDEDDESLRSLIRDHGDTIYHPVGTCRMGADAGSVVDPTLKVRGIDGLRVADASIMPTLISGNTEAPSAMIGEKAADLILRELVI